jgi:hypothetical protein
MKDQLPIMGKVLASGVILIMSGFELDFLDYATFVVLVLCVLIGLIFQIWLAGLHGHIAIAGLGSALHHHFSVPEISRYQP